MTHKNIEIQDLLLQYTKAQMARVILELRAACLFACFVACVGWGVAIWKML